MSPIDTARAAIAALALAASPCAAAPQDATGPTAGQERVILIEATDRLVARTLPADDVAGPAPVRWQAILPGLRPELTDRRDLATAVLVPPPPWMPGQPGHAAFRAQHSKRPSLVWLGTDDGRIQALDAASGAVVMTTAAPAGTGAGGMPRHPRNPCPRPQAADVRLRDGTWRTVLLCGMPAREMRDAHGLAQPGNGPPAPRRQTLPPPGIRIYVLDISRITAGEPPPVLLVRETSPALPLSAAGPVRALALGDPLRPRWHALSAIAHPRGVPRPGLALLPLDPDAPDIVLPLPAQACAGGVSASPLLAASVLNDAAGMARAAYAVDAAAQLWRFDLPDLATGRDRRHAAACLHAPTAGASRLDGGELQEAAPPLLFAAPGGHLAIYGSGSSVHAVFDAGPLAQRRAVPATPVDAAMTEGGAVVLRAPSAPPAPPTPGTPGLPAAQPSGWRLDLPHAGERVHRLLPAGPAHLAIVSVDASGGQRAYLVTARRGDSSGSLRPGLPAMPIRTGQAVGPQAHLLVTQASRLAGPPTLPGKPATVDITYTLWSIEGGIATPLNRIHDKRRKGRLSWRELIHTPASEPPP